MNEELLIDHLFRHQYGKMVSILTRIFGLSHLEVIEDAVQDTFALAMLKWRNKIPENPEAWLTLAAKNRAIDLFRKIKADQNRIKFLESGPGSMVLNELFLDHEVADSQLRMIFTACHPALNPKEQISFALKTISGFSTKEIASALLLKEETIKKRLARARKSIQKNNISFDFPSKKEIPKRLEQVLEVIYLIFNEGFHSGSKENLIRQDVCGEAIRLCKMILEKPFFRSGAGYALFGLMCFHASRLESRTNDVGELLDIKNQDRSTWHFPMIALGHDSLQKSVEYEETSIYHFEAAIAAEHLQSTSFETTNWEKILKLYKQLYIHYPTPFTLLNIAVVLLQLNQHEEAFEMLHKIDPALLEQRKYLYYGTLAEYYQKTGQPEKTISSYDQALEAVKNESERNYLIKKRNNLPNNSSNKTIG